MANNSQGRVPIGAQIARMYPEYAGKPQGLNLAVVLTGVVPISHHVDSYGNHYNEPVTVDLDTFIENALRSKVYDLIVMAGGLQHLRQGRRIEPMEVIASEPKGRIDEFVNTFYRTYPENARVGVSEYIAYLRTLTIHTKSI